MSCQVRALATSSLYSFSRTLDGPHRGTGRFREEKSLAPAGNRNEFLGASAGSLLTVRFANFYSSTIQSTFAPYCFATVTVHLSAVKFYECQEMLTARGVILTLKQDVPHNVCLARRTAQPLLHSCQLLRWLMINVHRKEIMM